MARLSLISNENRRLILNHDQSTHPIEDIDQASDLLNIVRSRKPALLERAIQCSVESDDEFPSDSALAQQACAIEKILDHAIASSPTGSDILITAVAVDTGIEIEIADSSQDDFASDSSRLETASFPFLIEQARQLLSFCGGSIRAYRCPQGGMAYTVFIPSETKRAAA